MTIEEIRQFRQEFKSIVYQRAEIQKSNNRLRDLHAWDKNGSHHNAILIELETKKSLQIKLKEMMKGVEYEEWLFLSKTLSKYVSRLTKATKQKEETEKIINDIHFKPITNRVGNILPKCDKCDGDIKRKNWSLCPTNGKKYCEKCIYPDSNI